MVNDVTMIEAGPMPDYREIDLASEQGLALLRSAADRYGEAIVQAAGIASRLFLLRSPWAPGLRFVGGQTKPEESDDDGNPFETLSLSGTGETLEEALVSCIGEGIERLAQFERSGDVRARAALPRAARPGDAFPRAPHRAPARQHSDRGRRIGVDRWVHA